MKSLRTVMGQPSWRLASKDIEVFVTQTGGHMGPVTFDRDGRCLQPLAVAPWAGEEVDPGLPPVLKVLRGDFFCLPFGGNETVADGERHPVHGESANSVWALESLTSDHGMARLHLSLKTRVRRGQVDKHLLLVDGHPAVYSRHVISGMRGAMCFGHHAMVRFPDRPGSGVVSTSPFAHGQVFPEAVEHPERRGYSILKPGAEFKSLQEVPTQFGTPTDLSRYPARRGYEDIVMIVSDPEVPFAWTAVTFPRERYAWFALKDPRVLRSTVFWFSNGGRHYPPWNGRHVNVLGLEEVTANFHYGLAESTRINPLSSRGFATSHVLRPDSPTSIPYIQAVATLPAGFDRVARIEARTDSVEGVLLHSANGKSVPVPLRLGFLRGEES